MDGNVSIKSQDFYLAYWLNYVLKNISQLKSCSTIAPLPRYPTTETHLRYRLKYVFKHSSFATVQMVSILRVQFAK
jgi:hypothetical protein